MVGRAGPVVALLWVEGGCEKAAKEPGSARCGSESQEVLCAGTGRCTVFGRQAGRGSQGLGPPADHAHEQVKALLLPSPLILRALFMSPVSP